MPDDTAVFHVFEQQILQVEVSMLFLQIMGVLYNWAGRDDRETGVADCNRIVQASVGHMGYARDS